MDQIQFHYDLPEIPAADLADQVRSLDVTLRLLFPDEAEAATGSPVELATDLLTRYALDLTESGHIAEIGEATWAIHHPLACRPRRATCPVNLAMVDLGDGIADKVFAQGFYRVVLADDDLIFTPYTDYTEESTDGTQGQD